MRSANNPSPNLHPSDHDDEPGAAASTAGLAPGGAEAAGGDSADTDGLEEAGIALDGALDKRALEPVLLDVRGLCSYANYLLIVSGRSDRQVEAICDGVLAAMKAQDHELLGIEGKSSGQWALIDFGDLVVHVFHHPVREHYDLEGLWIEAKRVPIEVPNDARISADDMY
ncbi:ribosome silencing factor [Haliangium sp.]|uniref:ribosome silencing factor n=1 Tax=Haliangium sp. TaxID=2663208 RepID=UPI003D0ABB3A